MSHTSTSWLRSTSGSPAVLRRSAAPIWTNSCQPSTGGPNRVIVSSCHAWPDKLAWPSRGHPETKECIIWHHFTKSTGKLNVKSHKKGGYILVSYVYYALVSFTVIPYVDVSTDACKKGWFHEHCLTLILALLEFTSRKVLVFFNLPFTCVSLCMCFVHTSLLCNEKPIWTQHICSCATAKQERHQESYSKNPNIMTMTYKYLETLCFRTTTSLLIMFLNKAGACRLGQG